MNDDLLESAKKRIAEMTKEDFLEIFEKIEAPIRARKKLAEECIDEISKIIVEKDLCIDNQEMAYFPEKVMLNFPNHTAEQVSAVLNHDDGVYACAKYYDEENCFPHEYIVTKYGTTYFVMVGQGTFVRLFKTKLGDFK